MLDSPKIITIGESIIDLIASQPVSHKKADAFQKFFGGAPMNTAVGIARLGGSVGVITAVGDDFFGHFMKETLKMNGVDTQYVIFKKDVRTTLAFVANEPGTGERSFLFYRKPWSDTADSNLTVNDFSPTYITSAEILHISGFALSQEPSRSTILQTAEEAKNKGVKISLDPTLRPDVWKNHEVMHQTYNKAISLADIASFSVEESEELLGTTNPKDAANTALDSGVKIVGLKRGKHGSIIASSHGDYIETEAVNVKPIDTTGAGDAWNSALLVGLAENWPLKACAIVANAVGALVVTAKGAITAFPTRKYLITFLHNFNLNKSLKRMGVTI